MEQWISLLLLCIPLPIVLLIDRKMIRKYILLGIFTIICATIYESITTYLGFWFHYSQPQILGGASIWTLLGYFPYISYSYFLGNKLTKYQGWDRK